MGVYETLDPRSQCHTASHSVPFAHLYMISVVHYESNWIEWLTKYHVRYSGHNHGHLWLCLTDRL